MLQFVYKNKRKRLPHNTTRSPSSPDMAICIGRRLSTRNKIEQGFNLAFVPFFSGGAFCDSVLGELPPAGGRVIGRSFRVVLRPFLPLLGGVTFVHLLSGVFFFSSCRSTQKGGRGKLHHPKGDVVRKHHTQEEVREHSSTRKERELHQPHPKAGEGKTAPPKGRKGRQHHPKAPSLRSPPPFDGAAFLCLLWVARRSFFQ